MSSEPTDEQLMSLYVHQGDRVAFRALFDRYAPRLAGYFRRQVGAEELATDLVQTTFLHLHRARMDFRDGQALRPWLFTIAANVGRDHARRRFRKPEHLVAEPAEVPTAPLEPADPAVQRALQELAPRDREVVVLRWYGELSFAEVAQVCGTTEAAVKARAKRALEQLRSLLGVARVRR